VAAFDEGSSDSDGLMEHIPRTRSVTLKEGKKGRSVMISESPSSSANNTPRAVSARSPKPPPNTDKSPRTSAAGGSPNPFASSEESGQARKSIMPNGSDVNDMNAGTRMSAGGDSVVALPSHLSAYRGSSMGNDCRQSSRSVDFEAPLQAATSLSRQFRSQQHRQHWQDATWRFMMEPESGRAARFFSMAMNPLIFGSLLVPFMMQIGEIQQHVEPLVFSSIEVSVEVFFACELLIRFIVCPSHRGFIESGYNIIDAFTVFPLGVRAISGFGVPNQNETTIEMKILAAFLLGVVPILRLLKLVRRFEKIHLIIRAVEESMEAMPVLCYTLCLMVLFFAMFLFVVEPQELNDRPHAGASLPESVWLTLVTIMTVGYGEITPVTPLGKIVVCIMMPVAALFLAIPVGIVGFIFHEVWEDRARYLIIRRARDRLKLRGYQGVDILEVFDMYDTGKSGEIAFKEFRGMLTAMKVDLNACRIKELFEAFDADGSGTVDKAEFLQQMAPATFEAVYGETLFA